jgi:hypothetical protein
VFDQVDAMDVQVDETMTPLRRVGLCQHPWGRYESFSIEVAAVGPRAGRCPGQVIRVDRASGEAKCMGGAAGLSRISRVTISGLVFADRSEGRRLTTFAIGFVYVVIIDRIRTISFVT